MVSTIDEPELERALRELVVDAEAGGHEAGARQDTGLHGRPEAGDAPTSMPKQIAATSENPKLTENTFAGWPSPGGLPFSAFQILPKRMGEYQSPPTRKLDTAASRTIQGFTITSPMTQMRRNHAVPEIALGLRRMTNVERRHRSVAR